MEYLKLSAAIATIASIYYLSTIKVKLWAAAQLMATGIDKLATIVLKTQTTVVLGLKLAYYAVTGQIAKCRTTMMAMRAA